MRTYFVHIELPRAHLPTGIVEIDTEASSLRTAKKLMREAVAAFNASYGHYDARVEEWCGSRMRTVARAVA